LLTPFEKFVFFILALISAGFTLHGFVTIIRTIRLGRPAPPLKNLPQAFLKAAVTVLLQRTILRTRKLLSVIHMALFFGLITYAFVNLIDVLEGIVPGFDLVYSGKHVPGAPLALVRAYNLISDVMSGFLLFAITVFLVRRFILKDKALTYRENVLLYPKVKAGGPHKDSLIVGVFRDHACQCSFDEPGLSPGGRPRSVDAACELLKLDVWRFSDRCAYCLVGEYWLGHVYYPLPDALPNIPISSWRRLTWHWRSRIRAASWIRLSRLR
jgi:hypothetical protein